MKLQLKLFLVIYCCLSAFCNLMAQDSRKDRNQNAFKNATQPEGNDESFVNGSGYPYDLFLFRDEVPNGLISYEVTIDRFYSSMMEFDQNGFLTNAQDLIARKLIPPTARVIMRIFDVDHNSQFDGNNDGIADPEVDYVYVNGNLITESDGNPRTLSSGNDTWSTWSVDIPISFLKFPQKEGSTSSKPSAANVIDIAIDVPNTGYWAVECDWIEIQVESPIRPIVMVHGWGLGSAESWNTFQRFSQDLGINSLAVTSLDPCGAIFTNAELLNVEINQALERFGVDKVNLFAHSKGGLDSRAYLRRYGNERKVEKMVQFSTPNHGSGLANLPLPCDPGEDQLNPDWIANNFNYLNEDINTPLSAEANLYKNDIFLLMAADDEFVSLNRGTLPWNALYERGFFGFGGLDLTEPINIVNQGSYEFSCILCMDHSEIINSQLVYNRALELISPSFPVQRLEKQPLAVQAISKNNAQGRQDVLSESFTLNGTNTRSFQVYIQSDTKAFFRLNTTELDFLISLKSPDNQAIDTTNNAFSLGFSEELGAIAEYEITNPIEGFWTIEVSNNNAAKNYTLRTSVETEKCMEVFVEKSQIQPGEALKVLAGLRDGQQIITGAAVQAVFSLPDGQEESLTLLDDGTGEDETANDGIYSASFPGTLQSGLIPVTFKGQKDNFTFVNNSKLVRVATPSVSFTTSFSERTQDTDFDGLFDHLIITTNLDVQSGGSFFINANLMDDQGNVITSTIVNTGNLNIGIHTIELSFDGFEIGEYGFSGNYVISALSITDVVSGITNDFIESPYQTRFYNFRSFERPSFVLTTNRNEDAVDTDGDGKYNFLDIILELDVAFSGTYTLSAELIDVLGDNINWTEDNIFLSSGVNQITIRFLGTEIQEKGVNGPYTLTNFSIYNTNLVESFFDVYVTNTYTFNQFEGLEITGTLREFDEIRPIVNTQVLLQGDKLATTKTDSSGVFAFRGLEAGNYSVLINKEGYCDMFETSFFLVKDTIFAIVLHQIPSKPEIQQVNDTDSLQSSINAENYEWYLDGVALNTNQKTILALESGTYELIVSNGPCEPQTSEPFEFTVTDLFTSNYSQKTVFFPNPSHGIMAIDSDILKNNPNIEISLFNFQGIKVHYQKGVGDKIDLSHLIPGTYAILLNNNGIMSYQKILIE